jgi:predicted Zn-dependent protease
MRFLIFLLLFLSSCASTVEKGRNMTPREEYFLGRSVAATILKDSPLYHGKINKYLNTLGKYLAYNSSRPETYKGYYFGLIKNKRPIAISSPGGIILISTGLLNKVKNEDQLAAVLAHEISHIALYHSQKTIDQSSWSKIGSKLGVATIAFLTGSDQLNEAVQNYDELISDYSSRLIDGVYNKEQELEADKEALSILNKTGFDSMELINIIKGLDETGGGLLSNHPSNEIRIETANSLIVDTNTNGKITRKKRYIREKEYLSL